MKAICAEQKILSWKTNWLWKWSGTPTRNEHHKVKTRKQLEKGDNFIPASEYSTADVNAAMLYSSLSGNYFLKWFL